MTTPSANLKSIVDLLQVAKAKGCEWPKLKMKTPNGNTIVLSLAGHGARFPGTVNVKDAGSYPYNMWYGRITHAGEFFRNRQLSPDITAGIHAELAMLAAEPAAYAKVQGQRTGFCMFCGRPLTNLESVAHGYGPICAENFNLPWGDLGLANTSNRDADMMEELADAFDDGQSAAHPPVAATDDTPLINNLSALMCEAAQYLAQSRGGGDVTDWRRLAATFVAIVDKAREAREEVAQ